MADVEAGVEDVGSDLEASPALEADGALAAGATGPPLATSRRWLDIAVPLALFAGTILTRLPRLTRPDAYVFDEVYYAPDAADIVRRGIERGGVVHPPVGKWLIGIGIKLFGYTSFGWRAGALVCGALVVVLVYATARQVVHGRALPALAGVLASLDGIAFTTGRAAMLDVFVALFTMLAVWCTLAALKRADDERAVRRYRLGAAISVGFGIATKWTVGYVLLVVLLGFLLIFTKQERRPHQGRAVLRTVLTLTLVPGAVYVATYIPWLVKAEDTGQGYVACVKDGRCDLSLVDRFVLFKDDQLRVLDFHRGLKSDNNSNADFAWRWINQAKPAVLFKETCAIELRNAPPNLDDKACDGASPGSVVEIVTVANPVVWYAALAAAIVLLVKVFRRGNLAALLLLLFVVYQWFPWVLDPFAPWQRQERRAYSFYLSGMIPVMAIWPAVALEWRKVRWVAAVLAVAAIGAFAYYWPIWAGYPLSPGQIKAREYWVWDR